MTPQRVLVPLVLAGAMLLTACGTSGHKVEGSRPTILRPVPPSPIAFRFSTTSNREFARRDARKLIRIVVVPHGARPVTEVPKSAPAWFRDEFGHGFAGAAIVHRTWVVHEPLKAVVRFIRTHERRRPRALYGYGSSTTRIGSRPRDNFSFPPIPGRSSSRWLNVAMLALPNGATVVTAQAGDAWIKPPRRSAELPGTVKTIDITSGYRAAHPVVRLHVRDRYDVGSVVAWMNGLGVAPNYICFGQFYGPTVTLTFRGASGKVLARASEGGAAGGPCGALSLTVAGRKAPPLLTGDLVPRIDRLLDANLAPPLQSVVASCLRGRGWHVRTVGRELMATQHGSTTTLTFHLTGKVTRTGPRHTAIARCRRMIPYAVHYG